MPFKMHFKLNFVGFCIFVLLHERHDLATQIKLAEEDRAWQLLEPCAVLLAATSK